MTVSVLLLFLTVSWVDLQHMIVDFLTILTYFLDLSITNGTFSPLVNNKDDLNFEKRYFFSSGCDVTHSPSSGICHLISFTILCQ